MFWHRTGIRKCIILKISMVGGILMKLFQISIRFIKPIPRFILTLPYYWVLKMWRISERLLRSFIADILYNLSQSNRPKIRGQELKPPCLILKMSRYYLAGRGWRIWKYNYSISAQRDMMTA